MDSFARSVAFMQDSAYFNGTGADMPLGIFYTPDVPTIHNSNPGKVTADDMLSLIHALRPKYRNGAAFFC